MKILFKVIVLVSVLVCCYILWKLYNNFNINKGQLALAYGLIILVGGVVIGCFTDFDFKNQSLYDNREADPLSDWVKIQDRDKNKTRWAKFWNKIFGDPYADSLLDDLLQWELGNYYDRNELKSVEEIINKPAKPKNTFRPMPVVVFDEVNSVSPEKFRELTTSKEFEKRQWYRNHLNQAIPAWVFNEAGDSINPLDHEQSK